MWSRVSAPPSSGSLAAIDNNERGDHSPKRRSVFRRHVTGCEYQFVITSVRSLTGPYKHGTSVARHVKIKDQALKSFA